MKINRICLSHCLNGDILSQIISKAQRLQLLEIVMAYYQMQIPNFGTLKSLDVLKTVLNA